ncbi:MAG TPA: hypothetical protein VLI69_00040 [Gammaproteobacteria bacterium]|nr:hypothetical protein [Gammaproteobacteria bacterium]
MYDINFTMPDLNDHIDKLTIAVKISIAIGFVGTLGLITTWVKNFRDGTYKRSLFYLDQIKSYFSQAISLLNEGKNNNIKWHQAIEALKTADDLSSLLTEKPHQRIYVNDFMNTAYHIIDIINNIDDFRFFYGISDFKTIASSILYQESCPPSLDKPTVRIDPEILLCLCKFIDKAGRASHDMNQNKITSYDVFNSDYFNSSLKNNQSTSEFTKISMKVIFNYIKDFNLHKLSSANA